MLLGFEVSAQIELSFGIDLAADPTSGDSLFVMNARAKFARVSHQIVLTFLFVLSAAVASQSIDAPRRARANHALFVNDRSAQ